MAVDTQTVQAWWLPSLAALALLALVFQVLGCVRSTSATFDEPYHLGAGYAYLRTGDSRLSSDHPPLIDLWLSIPLAGLDLNLPLESPAWEQAEYGTFGDVFLWQANAERAQEIIWWGRLPNLALALILGAALFRWTTQLTCRLAGLSALVIYALDPNIVAHASLATNDLGVTALFFLATWAWWNWLEHPTLLRLGLAGITTGAVCASKYSGLAIIPVAVLLAAVHRPKGTALWHLLARRIAGIAGLLLFASLTIWGIYGFAREGSIPAPHFWVGLRFQMQRIASGQPVYALGRVWPHGVWFYYPIALVSKTPLPTITLILMGVLEAVQRRTPNVLKAFGLPIVLFGTGAMISSLQLGYRYLLLLLPFAFGLAGYATEWPLHFSHRSTRVALVSVPCVFGIWLFINALCIYPHNLSFFNELVGGPLHGDTILVDSNLDWGQDLPALRDIMKEHRIPYVRLGYFGSAVPDVYGIRYWPAPGFLRFVSDAETMAFNPYTPEPGWYAISCTSLRQGLVLTHHDVYAAFRDRQPDARAGYSINLYRLEYPADTPISRAVVQSQRVADIPAEQLGWQTGQRLIVKWMPNDRSLVLAMNGPARYLVQKKLSCIPELWTTLQTGSSPVDAVTGAFIADARTVLKILLEQWTSTAELWTPEGERMHEQPVFDGRLSLRGYQLQKAALRAGTHADLVLFWEVVGEIQPPLASFVHLLDVTGGSRTQYDGWGSAVSGLEKGDWVISCVSLPLPPDLPPGRYRLQVGVYSPDTMARWPVQLSDGRTFDRLWLEEIEVH